MPSTPAPTRPPRPVALRALASVLCGLLAGTPLAARAAAPAAKAAAPAAKPAGSKPSLAVVSFGVDDASAGAAARLSKLGEQLAREAGQHDLQELAALLDPAATRSARERADEARHAYEVARRYYDELEVNKAAENCDKALALFEKADLSVSFDQLVKASILRIAALIANADNRTAGIELNLLLPLDLTTPFDPNLFAPDFIAQVKQRREEIKGKATLALDVQTRPAPGRVYLDGAFRGVSPVELRNLPPGDHFLTIITPGYQMVQKRVRPGVGAVETVLLEPASKLGLLLAQTSRMKNDPWGSGLTKGGHELARQLGLDEVLVVGVAERNSQGLRAVAARIDVEGREQSYVEETLPSEEARFGPAAERFLTKALTGRGTRSVTSGKSWTPRHTGYALTGLGVAAAAVGLGFGIGALDKQSAYRSATGYHQAHQELAKIAEDGRTYALVADLAFVGALVMGGTGLFLALTGRGPAAAGDADQNLEEKRSVISTGDSGEPAPSGKERKAKKAKTYEDEDLRDD